MVKINEPKTPYRGPQQAEADEFDAPPVSGGFALDGEASSSGEPFVGKALMVAASALLAAGRAGRLFLLAAFPPAGVASRNGAMRSVPFATIHARYNSEALDKGRATVHVSSPLATGRDATLCVRALRCLSSALPTLTPLPRCIAETVTPSAAPYTGLSTGRSTSDISMSPPRSPHGEQAASGGLGLGPMVAEDHSIPTTSWGSDLAHAQHTPGAAAGGADEDMAESDGQPQPQRQQEASVVPRCSFDSSGEEGETQEARHRRFETMRKAHYNMRELLKARPPSDDEEGEEEGNDGGGTSSAGARGGAAG